MFRKNARLLASSLVLLAACSTLPSRTIYVRWDTPPCGDGPQMRAVQFVDSLLPLVECVKASNQEDATKIVLLTLMGLPIAACAVTVNEIDQRGFKMWEHTTIYSPVSPTPTQLLTIVATGVSPDALLEHEIGHAFGSVHGGGCRP
jgi:hypothetical protein